MAPHHDDEEGEETFRIIPLSEKERDQKGRELAAAVLAFYDMKDKAKTEAKKYKAKVEKLEAEVKRLQRAVSTGQESVNAQEVLNLES